MEVFKYLVASVNKPIAPFTCEHCGSACRCRPIGLTWTCSSYWTIHTNTCCGGTVIRKICAPGQAQDPTGDPRETSGYVYWWSRQSIEWHGVKIGIKNSKWYLRVVRTNPFAVSYFSMITGERLPVVVLCVRDALAPDLVGLIIAHLAMATGDLQLSSGA